MVLFYSLCAKLDNIYTLDAILYFVYLQQTFSQQFTKAHEW